MTPKTLVSLTLVATQLLSWNASSLYACVSGNGVVCVDFGPDSCLCCQHEPADSTDAQHVACAHRHGHEHACDDAGGEHTTGNASSESKGAQASPDPCDCVHLVIVQPRCTVRTSATADGPFDYFTAVAPAVVAMLPADHDACGELDRFASRVLRSGAATLAARATTVIRC